MGQSTVLQIASGHGKCRLILSFQCRVDGQKLTILLDGNPIAVFQPLKEDEFQDVAIPLASTRQSHRLEIRYGKWEPIGGVKPVIVYRKIQFLDQPLPPSNAAAATSPDNAPQQIDPANDKAVFMKAQSGYAICASRSSPRNRTLCAHFLRIGSIAKK